MKHLFPSLLLLLAAAVHAEESTNPEAQKWMEAQAASHARAMVQFADLINDTKSGFVQHCDDEIAIAEKNNDPILQQPDWPEKIGRRVMDKFFKGARTNSLDDELMVKIKKANADRAMAAQQSDPEYQRQLALKQKEAEAQQLLEIEDFAAGKWVTFSTKDHAKANGLNITIKHPNWWLPNDGDRPHIVKKFSSPGGLISAALVMKDIGANPPRSELLAALSPEEMKKNLPPGYKLIEVETATVDGLPASLMMYSTRQKVGVIDLDMVIVNWTFFYKTSMINLMGTVSGAAGQEEKLIQTMKEMLPVFMLMANSIVVQDQWK